MKEPLRFFTNAEETKKMLDESGLQNFVCVDTFEENSSRPKQDFAERIFAVYNDGAEIQNPLGTKEGQNKLRSLGVSHTSMSVNDFVVIDDQVLIVDSLGFKNIGKHDALKELYA